MTDRTGERRIEAGDVPVLEDALLRNERIWVVGVDDSDAVTVWNDAAAAVTGHSAADVLGDDAVWTALAPDGVDRLDVPTRLRKGDVSEDASAETSTEEPTGTSTEEPTGTAVETPIRTADGERRVIAWYSSEPDAASTIASGGSAATDGDETGGPPRGETLLLARDVTRGRRRETQLERVNRAMRDLLTAESRTTVAEIAAEAAHDVLGLEATTVYLAEEDGTVLRPAASTEAAKNLSNGPPVYRAGDSIVWRAYERGRTSTIGDVRDDPDVHNPDTPIRSQLNLPLEDHGVLVVGSHRVGAFDDHDLTVGEVLAGNVVAALDAVERKQSLTRQNERLEQFSRVVSHDVRNPLNVARGRIDLARTDGDVGHLAAADRALDRIETLIDDLLMLARDGRPTGDPVPVALSAVIDACRETVEVDRVDLRVETDQVLLGDRGRLQQLFENLIRNAVEHGSTSSRTRSDDAVERGLTDERRQGRERNDASRADVIVTIGRLEDGGGFFFEDEGPGIPVEERGDVFDPGFSTASQGTGFGLSIVDRIADDHGWNVRVTEGRSGGARFEFRGVDWADEEGRTPT